MIYILIGKGGEYMMIMQTGLNVSDLSATSSIKEIVKVTDGGSSKFENLMEKTSNSGSNGKVQDSHATVKKLFASNGKSDMSISESELDNVVFEEAATQLVKQIVQFIQEITGCSQEQAEQMLSAMDEPFETLCNGNGIREIVMKVNDLTEPSELLVDKEACEQLQMLNKEIGNLISKFANDNGISLEDLIACDDLFKKVLQDLEVSIATERVESDETMAADVEISVDGNDEAANVDDVTQISTDKNDEVTANVIETKDTDSDIEKIDANVNIVVGEAEVYNTEDVQDDVTKTDTQKNQIVDEFDDESVVEEGNVPEIETVKEDSYSEDVYTDSMVENIEKNKGDNQGNTGQNKSGSQREMTPQDSQYITKSGEKSISHDGVVNNLFQSIKETIDVEIVGEPQQESFASRILNQVIDGIKVMTSEDMSSMEMQLNPESLGKMSIQVISKNGVVTAQIAAQSEAVKEAVESQIAILRQNMEEHGLKVEDVEVTVASHDLGQDSGNENNGSHDESGRRKHASDTASSVAADIKAVKEEVAEEIIKEQKGSTVSYSA